jgi:hypothetical protein
MTSHIAQPTQSQHLAQPPCNTDPYSTLAHFFVELRGRGLSLSAMDTETLFKWKSTQVPVEIIMDIAWSLADECLAQNRPFPASLAPINQRLQRYLKKQKEF